jgi:pyruvate formate lyase activating enzyme
MPSSGLVTELKRFATHDGPGIRTTVFFKGCPLRCRWCSNPEGLAPGPELLFHAHRCRSCGACVGACPERAIALERDERIDRVRCTLCWECVAACPHGAYRRSGRQMTAAELEAEVEKDRPFYRIDGGITLCGGEPLAQPELALELLGRCRAARLSTVLDTSGHAPPEVVRQAAKLADLVLLDIKHMDPAAHRATTGVDNALVLSNAQLLARGTRIRLTLPLVPGFNDTADNLTETARLALRLGAEAIDVLAVHELGRERYRHLGRPLPERQRAPTPEELACAVRVIAEQGVETTIGRMM